MKVDETHRHTALPSEHRTTYSKCLYYFRNLYFANNDTEKRSEVQTDIRHIRISTRSFATARRAVRRNLVNCRTCVGTIQVLQLFHNKSTCNQFAMPTSHIRLVTLVKCRFNASVTVIHDTTDTLQTTDADADVVTLLRDDPARSPFSPCPRSTGPEVHGSRP